jgi:hypothetical protein
MYVQITDSAVHEALVVQTDEGRLHETQKPQSAANYVPQCVAYGSWCGDMRLKMRPKLATADM